MDTEGLVLVWPYFEACFRLYASFAKYQRSAHYRYVSSGELVSMIT